jgi:DNA topoisomerase-1
VGKVLVICEKPTAAERVAEALDEMGKPRAFREMAVPYFVAKLGSLELTVVSALGHLFTLAQRSGSWTYPIFDIQWVPAYTVDKESRTKNFVEAIGKLSVGAEEYISACDYDVEGSLIAYTILLYICGEESLKRARRMKFSTLTRRDLKKAYEERMPTLDFPMIYAGKARHEVDFLFGINLSRALTLSVKRATGNYKTLSTGRVQGPTLNFIKEREEEIRAFVPEPYWIIEAETIIEGKKYPLEYSEPRIPARSQAEEVVNACRGAEGAITEINSRSITQAPLAPFNLGDLQREAYSLFKYSPRTTLNAAEQLYLGALISYPRTSSQRIPPSIDIKGILNGLAQESDYRRLTQQLLSKPSLRPRQGAKDDPAHPAVHPTGNLPEGKLTPVQSRLFDLVVRRFMAALGDPAVLRSVRADVDVKGHLFYLRGRQTEYSGWMEFYSPYLRREEVVLPPLKVGQRVPVSKLEAVQKFTSPPSRFNPSSLLKLMEDAEIGTKATRTEIIDTLFRRGYVAGESIDMTDLGFAIVETIGKYCPAILSVEMTRELEQDMDLIQLGKREAEAVVVEAVETLKPILEEFKAKEKLIGVELNTALRVSQSKENILGSCPTCKTGIIRIVKNRNTGKRFAGCSNYLKGCRTSYPLPQAGKIEPTGKSCPVCGAPIIKAFIRGKRFMTFCINFDCPSKKSRRQELGATVPHMQQAKDRE